MKFSSQGLFFGRRSLKSRERGAEKIVSIKIEEQYTTSQDAHLVFLKGLSRAKGPRAGSVIVCSTLVLQRGLSLLEDLPAGPVIVLQSSLRVSLEEGNSAFQRDMRRFLFGVSAELKERFIALNEVCSATFSSQDKGESSIIYANRLMGVACLYMHAAIGLDLVVLCVAEDDPAFRACADLGIPVRTLRDHISATVIQADDKELMLARLVELEPLEASDEGDSSPPGQHQPHWPLSRVREAVRTNRLLLGTVEISRFSMRRRALVRLQGPLPSEMDGADAVLVSGLSTMNRCLDGDLVGVQCQRDDAGKLLWQRVDGLHDLEGEEKEKGAPEGSEDDRAAECSLSLDQAASSSGAVPVMLKFTIPCAQVVAIVRQSEQATSVLALFPASTDSGSGVGGARSSAAVLVRPAIKTLPLVRVRTRLSSQYAGCYILVRIHSWPNGSSYPEGHILRNLGAVQSMSWRQHVNVLLVKHCLHGEKPFSPAALACLPRLVEASRNGNDANNEDIEAWTPTPHDLRGRRDFRDTRRVVSIDPPGCQDIDDAMHVQWLTPDSGGRTALLEFGVHIADVSHFLPQGCALDREAQLRGSTIYMPHERVDMLPARLSGNLCSLHCQTDRLAVSVTWKVGVTRRDGAPVSPGEDPLELQRTDDLVFSLQTEPVHWAGKSVIHSLASMTYQQAQDLCDYGFIKADDRFQSVPRGQAGGSVRPSLQEALSRDVKWLVALGRHLKARRMSGSRGGIDLEVEAAQPQLRFGFDRNSSLPVQLEGSTHLEVHSTVAEMMILANSSVAEYLTRPPVSHFEEGKESGAVARLKQLARATLIRVHPPPSIAKLRALEAFLRESHVPVPENEVKEGELSHQQLLSRIRTLRKVLHAVDPATGERFLTGDQGDLVMGIGIRSMQEATYTPCSGGTDGDDDSRVHVGLGLTHYTHFTSPIRRYADIIVHRQLLEAIALRDNLEDYEDILVKLDKADSFLERESVENDGDASSPPSSGEDEEDFLDALLDDVGDELLPEAPAPYESLTIAPESPLPNHSSLARAGGASRGEGGSGPLHRDVARVASLCNSLNRITRGTRHLAADLQHLFLRLYFNTGVDGSPGQVRQERHQGVVCSVRHDAVRVYLPALNLTSSLVLAAGDIASNKGAACSEAALPLKMLQQVEVVVCGDGQGDVGLPDLLVSLASHEPLTGVSPTVGAKEVVTVNATSSSDGLATAPLVAASHPPAASPLRECVSSFSASVEYMRNNPHIAPVPPSKSRTKKNSRSSEITFFSVPGSGRMYFAPGGSKEAPRTPPPVFLAHASQTSDACKHAIPTTSKSHSGTTGSGSAAAMAVTGIEAARARMKAWGEQWGEEEHLDLPDMQRLLADRDLDVSATAGSHNSSASNTSSGGANLNGKQMRLITSRLDKVKTAKRKY